MNGSFGVSYFPLYGGGIGESTKVDLTSYVGSSNSYTVSNDANHKYNFILLLGCKTVGFEVLYHPSNNPTRGAYLYNYTGRYSGVDFENYSSLPISLDLDNDDFGTLYFNSAPLSTDIHLDFETGTILPAFYNQSNLYTEVQDVGSFSDYSTLIQTINSDLSETYSSLYYDVLTNQEKEPTSRTTVYKFD